MAELATVIVVAVVYAVGWLLWHGAQLLWELLKWATEPIRDEIALQRMQREEMEKRERILATHREAQQNIDTVAASSLKRLQAAANLLDGDPRRRQSG